MADNQFINFNSQDVADMYRRNQYARMLQEQANAPIERASYKGIEAPLHPVQGVAKLAAALLAGHQQNQMDERYSNEKAAAEQKLVAEQERRRGEVAAYGRGFGPETAYTNAAGGDVNNYTPQTQMTSTPRSPAQLLAHELSGMGSDNELIRNMARASSERRGAEAQEKTRLDERAVTEATRQRERQEDIKIRAGEFNIQQKAAEQNRNAKSNVLTSGVKDEIIKTNDMVNSISGTIDMLKQARSLNKLPTYSGYGAYQRAIARSNLPGESEEASNTINLENIMVGQTLESLKATFGGLPTEGERKILLEIQASTNKSPADRELIIGRAIDLANKKLSYHANKAESLKSGDYFNTPESSTPKKENRGATVSNWNK